MYFNLVMDLIKHFFPVVGRPIQDTQHSFFILFELVSKRNFNIEIQTNTYRHKFVRIYKRKKKIILGKTRFYLFIIFRIILKNYVLKTEFPCSCENRN